jgi:hypothetical protein
MTIIRVRAPRFIFFSIYGTIVLDVICTTGPRASFTRLSFPSV